MTLDVGQPVMVWPNRAARIKTVCVDNYERVFGYIVELLDGEGGTQFFTPRRVNPAHARDVSKDLEVIG